MLAAGKSRGFAFAAYEDQRSTVLAVDNLSGARVAGRTIRVEHVDNYKRKKAEVQWCMCTSEHAAGVRMCPSNPWTLCVPLVPQENRQQACCSWKLMAMV